MLDFRMMVRVVWIGPALALAAGLTGCSGGAASATGEPAEQQERLAEVEVGTFSVPLVGTAGGDEDDATDASRHDLLLRFRLWVAVPPGREDDVARGVATHGARLREDVVHVCRSASLDELSEPALGTLKRRLMPVLIKYLGGRYLRHVILTKVLLEPT